ncbi:MAG TPA: copper chaperone PCu(A)C [Stellaceae bacterium]|nr:copper chaperone PCu(A)C [Stellaceae bacterium]
MLRRSLLIALLSPLAATGARAHSYVLGSVEIGHPWARPTSAQLGTVYCVLAVKGDDADTLSAAETPIATRVELRNAAGEAVYGIEIASPHPVVLRPGKPYLALVGLKQPLMLGDGFPLTLRFDIAGEITVTVMVENVPGE